MRTPSPRRRSHLHPQHDIGFSDTVSNVVEIVKEDHKTRGYRQNGRYPRGMFAQFTSHICLNSFKTKTTFLISYFVFNIV